MAKPARMRRRHWGVLASFALIVLLPLLAAAAYLWVVADDRYSSTLGFTVRKEEGAGASELLGGLAAFTGGTATQDGDVLYEFIRSQEMVRRVDETLNLRDYYSGFWGSDPLFALRPDATIEDLLSYWERIVRVSYDQGTGLVEVRVMAFDPDKAQAIARQVLIESQSLVNALNETARLDAIRYADQELEQTQIRLKSTREALTKFRTRTQIVDIQADIQGRMGVMNTLQQQLAAELVIFDELSSKTGNDDPRVTQALNRIRVIRERIAEERSNFATTKVTGTEEDYPTLIAEFEGLQVEREFAEEAYRAALAARDAAYATAERQSRYLATYVAPTAAESSQYPQRLLLLGLAGLFLCLGWGIAVLVYYSIRDKG
ncbi:sugar transporter [Pseudooceanicola sp. C21-150M6]|uniref:sugar transporter n=1 Tax=Pseudooceanicola sp. C21-150M6 TaxID=3434355 RepID=UPI003D7F1CD1